MTNTLKAGTRVAANYRVAPFLADEVLVVVSTKKVGRGKNSQLRTFVQSESRRQVQGWLDTDTLEVL